MGLIPEEKKESKKQVEKITPSHKPVAEN